MAKQDAYVRITLRLPAELHRSLVEAAGAQSLNAEIVERLEATVKVKFDENALSDLEKNTALIREEMAETRALIREQLAPSRALLQLVVDNNGQLDEDLVGIIREALKSPSDGG